MAERTPRKPKAAPAGPVVLPPGATAMDAVIFQKLTEMHQVLQALVGLLEELITRVEAQTQTPAAPIAPYAALYKDHPIVTGPPEGELVAAAAPPPRQVGGWRRFFTQRIEP
jgi:hypothetical protein